jgi:periplasmic protein CpxP/Spy
MRAFRPVLIALASTLALASSVHAQEGPDLQALHNALNLTPAQETAWSAFAAASTPDPEQAARDRAAQSMMPTLSAPQRVDLTIAAMQADLRTLERRGAALKSFYATLSPQQQVIFDRQTTPREEDER